MERSNKERNSSGVRCVKGDGAHYGRDGGQQEAMRLRDRTPLCGVDCTVLPLYLGYGVAAFFPS